MRLRNGTSTRYEGGLTPEEEDGPIEIPSNGEASPERLSSRDLLQYLVSVITNRRNDPQPPLTQADPPPPIYPPPPVYSPPPVYPPPPAYPPPPVYPPPPEYSTPPGYPAPPYFAAPPYGVPPQASYPAAAVPPQAFSGRPVVEFQKLRPPTYAGEADATILDNWLIDLEACFKASQCTDRERLVLAPFQLKGVARTWWNKEERGMMGASWDEFKRRLTNRFVPHTVQRQLRRDFLGIRQENKSMTDYHIEFERLLKYGGECVPTDYDKLQHFREGMRHNLRHFTSAPGIQTVEDALNVGLDVERSKKEESSYHDAKRKRGESSGTKKEQVEKRDEGKKFEKKGGGRRDEKKKRVTCSHCKKQGHTQDECWSKVIFIL